MLLNSGCSLKYQYYYYQCYNEIGYHIVYIRVNLEMKNNTIGDICDIITIGAQLPVIIKKDNNDNQYTAKT